MIRALTLNYGNLQWRWQAKGTSQTGEADSSDAPPRNGATRSSDETAVMGVERRSCIISAWASPTAQAGGAQPHDQVVQYSQEAYLGGLSMC